MSDFEVKVYVEVTFEDSDMATAFGEYLKKMSYNNYTVVDTVVRKEKETEYGMAFLVEEFLEEVYYKRLVEES